MQIREEIKAASISEWFVEGFKPGNDVNDAINRIISPVVHWRVVNNVDNVVGRTTTASLTDNIYRIIQDNVRRKPPFCVRVSVLRSLCDTCL
jgi:hypothetical protein